MSSDESVPRLSVVIPVHNGGRIFEVCLAALASSDLEDFETLVVDDASTDGTLAVAQAADARTLATPSQSGPAAARNLGVANARSHIVTFLDADCEVSPTTLGSILDAFDRHPEIDALFGSYDDRPAHAGRVSQFRNLLHHWIHQQSEGIAETFWAGCGAVRKAAFEEVGGFDDRRFPRPSIEDIDLGYRLRDQGHVIRLIPSIQVRHHKRWSLASMVSTDLARRAAPWTRLRIERGKRSRELNLDRRGQASIALTALTLAALAIAIVDRRAIALAVLSVAALCIVQWPFYAFLRRRGGWILVLVGIPLHLLHLASAGFGYLLGRVQHWFARP